MLSGILEADRIEFLAATLSGIGDGVIVADREGKVLYINESGEALTGLGEREALGRPFEEVFPLINYYSGARLESPIREALRQRKPLGLQNHSALQTREGRPRFVSASCSPIVGRDNQAEGIVVVFRDIHRIKTVEEEIKKEKDNLKTSLEALPTGVMLAGADLIVRWVNRPLLDLFHIREEEIVGQCFGDGFHCLCSDEKGGGRDGHSHACEMQQNIRGALSEGVSRKDVLIRGPFLRENAEDLLWLKMNFIPLASSEDPQVLISVEDVTEQKNYEEALRRSRDEEASANRIKSEFIANMSHEIRTPLNGLIGMMDLLLGTQLNADQLDYIQMARLSANNLLRVIGDILDYSKIEAGKIIIQSIAFDLAALMEETVKIHETLAEKKGLALAYEFSPQVPRYVTGDPDRLRQILGNLIANAIKFTDEGSVSITLRRAAPDKNLLEFQVSDTGIGISAEQMNLLFKRFSQADGSITRRHSGTGLGLAISKQLAELMGGEISTRSAPGEGSVFSLTLNLAPASEESAKANLGPQRELSAIVMEGAQVRPDAGEAQSGHIVPAQGCADLNLGSRVRIGGDGEILFGKAPAGEDPVPDLDELFALSRALKAVIRENRVEALEESAHKIRQLALLLGADELADLAFKAELSSRKCKWADAWEYAIMMINEIHFRYKEG